MPARTGAEYLAGLADQREIWFAGERVKSVVEHPILGRPARTLAELYDMQRDAALQSKLTYPSPTTGDPVSLAFIQPRSVDDLVRRRVMFKHWADFSGGMLGRTPDYLNAILAGCASSLPHFAKNGPEYAERISAYYEFSRERDLCATHAFVDPQINRERSQSEQADPSVPLHVIGDSAEGLIVSGARMLSGRRVLDVSVSAAANNRMDMARGGNFSLLAEAGITKRDRLAESQPIPFVL